MTPDDPQDATNNQDVIAAVTDIAEHESLKYHLLGPSLTKAGQDTVDQQKVTSNLSGNI